MIRFLAQLATTIPISALLFQTFSGAEPYLYLAMFIMGFFYLTDKP